MEALRSGKFLAQAAGAKPARQEERSGEVQERARLERKRVLDQGEYIVREADYNLVAQGEIATHVAIKNSDRIPVLQVQILGFSERPRP